MHGKLHWKKVDKSVAFSSLVYKIVCSGLDLEEEAK